ncbi:hypothetical protein DFH06DRAFT_1161584 [Mycena polygramma]|nr:hypothetical protein DFH06DRAFT_1161584 [Mycena polygramma]
MVTRTVLFMPRPCDEYFGIEWIPCSWFPFHPDHEEIPAGASDERQFDCSEALESHLLEFYQVIRPLLIEPYFDPASACTLYADYLAHQKQRKQDHAKIAAFHRKTKKCLIARFRALPQQKAVYVYEGKELQGEKLVNELMLAHIFLMQSELIELKVWSCICAQVTRYNNLWKRYVRRLNDCHPPDHRCSNDPRPVPSTSPDTQVVDHSNDQEIWASTTAYYLTAKLDFFSTPALYPSSGLRRRTNSLFQRSSSDTHVECT